MWSWTSPIKYYIPGHDCSRECWQPHLRRGDGPRGAEKTCFCDHNFVSHPHRDFDDVLLCTKCNLISRRSILDLLASPVTSASFQQLMRLRFSNERFFRSLSVCTYCKQEGHRADICPMDRTHPSVRIPWVETLLDQPRVQVRDYLDPKLPLKLIFKKFSMRGRLLNQGNPFAQSTSPQDALRAQLGFYKALGAPRSHSHLDNHISSKEDRKIASDKHEEATTKGWFSKVQPTQVTHVIPIQLERQSTKSFRLETLKRDGLLSIMLGDFMVTADLKKAYYRLLFDPQIRHLLGTRIGDTFFRSNVLVFGYALAPFYFHSIMRVIVSFLRFLFPKSTFIPRMAF
mmetsp:Transcript_6629/g.10154  ORF Transcript_6629/g.10154 Transcript_6629/m.10154 type:complete len:343 (-) Transcript_6629:873-1901(-)